MAIPEVVAAKRKLGRVIRILRRAGHSGWEDRLEVLLRAMDGWYGTKESLHAVGEVCHPRALGDLVVEGRAPDRWLADVAGLHDACALAFNLLERLPPGRRDSA